MVASFGPFTVNREVGDPPPCSPLHSSRCRPLPLNLSTSAGPSHGPLEGSTSPMVIITPLIHKNLYLSRCEGGHHKTSVTLSDLYGVGNGEFQETFLQALNNISGME